MAALDRESPATCCATETFCSRLSSATTSVPRESLCPSGRQRSAEHVVIALASATHGLRLAPSTMTQRAERTETRIRSSTW